MRCFRVPFGMRALKRREGVLLVGRHARHHRPPWPFHVRARSSGVPGKRGCRSDGGIENPLAVEVLAGRFAEGYTIVVEPDGETLRFSEQVPAAVAS